MKEYQEKCFHCNGEKRVTRVAKDSQGAITTYIKSKCPCCKGTGVINKPKEIHG